MKLMYLLLVIFTINFVLVATGVSDGQVNSLFEFLSNPSDWKNSPFSDHLGVTLALAGVGIIVGAMVFRNENLLWYGVAAMFLSFGSPLVDLFSYVRASVPGTAGEYIAYIVVAPLVLAYMMVVIYWARGRD